MANATREQNLQAQNIRHGGLLGYFYTSCRGKKEKKTTQYVPLTFDSSGSEQKFNASAKRHKAEAQ